VSTFLGQSLPLIPQSETIAHIFGAVHFVSTKVLLAALLLHIVGALKHHIIDKDLTLKRMLPGHTAPDIMPEQHASRTPFFTASAVYIAVIAAGVALGLSGKDAGPATPKLEAVASDWTVTDGTLGLTIRQLGSDVAGEFTDWTAAIEFTEEPDTNGLHGDVEVQIAIGSLNLGSVSDQAMGADFFAVEAFPTATFTAPITSTDGRFAANGTLTIKGVEAPVNLPFTLEITGDTAVMQGQATLNRTSFNIGESYKDESSLGFDVLIDISLSATKQN
jgi:polyisoprenoid-binding protein YceI